MEIFTAGVEIIKNVVTVIGGSMVIIGGIQYFTGHSENSATAKQAGMALFIGGGGICAIALKLIPMLASGF